VIDLMEALKASVAEAQGKKPAKAAAKKTKAARRAARVAKSPRVNSSFLVSPERSDGRNQARGKCAALSAEN
jgi:hypothetical protein